MIGLVKKMIIEEVERTTSSWNYAYALLLNYFKQEGHARVSREYKTSDGYKLGNWVTTQRYNFKKSQLSLERIKKMESIEGWSWNPKSEKWNDAYYQLKLFVEQEGHANIYNGYKTSDGFGLEGWIYVQRRNYYKNILDKDRIKKLESIKVWGWDLLTLQWYEGYSYLKKFADKEGHTKIPKEYKVRGRFNLSLWTEDNQKSYHKNKLTTEQVSKLESIEGWSWNPVPKFWHEGYSYLKEFIKQEGHAKIPATFKTNDGFCLGRWVKKQIKSFQQNKINDEVKEKLNAIDGWSWNPMPEFWHEGYSYLKEFVQQEGHAKIPATYKTNDGYALGKWVKKQIKSFQQNKINDEVKEKLNAIEGWSWNTVPEFWYEGYSYLKEFIKQVGHAKIPATFKTNDGYALGKWVEEQIKSFQQNKINDEVKEKLNAIEGWSWNPMPEFWHEGYSHLLRFVEQEGHSRVPGKYKTNNGYSLGSWISTQRNNCKKLQLSLENIQKMELIEDWSWNPKADKWNEGYSHLLKFVEQEGHSRVPGNYKTNNGYSLGKWVVSQISDLKKSKLTTEQIENLEQIKGWTWDKLILEWYEGYYHLKRFVELEGHSRVPSTYKVYFFTLGRWPRHQRNKFKSSKLIPEKINRLESLKGWFWNLKDEQWYEGYSYLKVFKENEGHSRVPSKHKTSDGYKLGNWVSLQRTNFKKNNLTHEKINKLELLNGWTW
jgi:hypothetical protein